MPWLLPTHGVVTPRRMPLRHIEYTRRMGKHRASSADRVAVGDGAAFDVDDVLGLIDVSSVGIDAILCGLGIKLFG